LQSEQPGSDRFYNEDGKGNETRSVRKGLDFNLRNIKITEQPNEIW